MAFQGTLTGNLGKDPELKTFQSGKMKVELAVAVRQQDKNAEAFWVQVDLWDKSAQYAADYLKKGDSIFAQGVITEEKFTRRNGELGHKVVLQYARIELFAKEKRTSTQPTGGTEYAPSNPQPTQPPATKGVEVLVPEVDEIPF